VINDSCNFIRQWFVIKLIELIDNDEWEHALHTLVLVVILTVNVLHATFHQAMTSDLVNSIVALPK